MTDGAPQYREGQQMELGAHRSAIGWLRVWVVLLTILATLGSVAGAVGYWRAGRAVNENCVRIHKIVDVGSGLIAGGRVSLAQYLKDGTISRAQYDRGVRQSDRQLALWRSADCQSPALVRLAGAQDLK